MISNLALRFLLAAGLVGILYYWFRPASTEEYAEKISQLIINGNSPVLSYSNDNSFFFDGGITRGELGLSRGQVQSMVLEARSEGYLFTDRLGLTAPIAVVSQKGCCDGKNISLNKHGGFYKVFVKDAKNSQYAIIDTTANRLYFLKLKLLMCFR